MKEPIESDTDQEATTVSGLLERGVMLHDIIRDMRFKFVKQRGIKPRYLIISPAYERELFRNFEQHLRPDLSIRESKFMDMEILVSRGTDNIIDLAA